MNGATKQSPALLDTTHPRVTVCSKQGFLTACVQSLRALTESGAGRCATWPAQRNQLDLRNLPSNLQACTEHQGPATLYLRHVSQRNRGPGDIESEDQFLWPRLLQLSKACHRTETGYRRAVCCVSTVPATHTNQCRCQVSYSQPLLACATRSGRGRATMAGQPAGGCCGGWVTKHAAAPDDMPSPSASFMQGPTQMDMHQQRTVTHGRQPQQQMPLQGAPEDARHHSITHQVLGQAASAIWGNVWLPDG